MLDARRPAAGRGRHRHRQDARLPPARGRARAPRRRLHRHQEPAGAARPEGHPDPGPGPRPRPERRGDEGPGELPVPPALLVLRARRAASAASRRSRSTARSRRGRRETETGDRAEVADLPDSVDFWREISAASENCIGQSCSLLRVLLRHAHAPAGARGRHRGRQPPPALRRPRGEGRQLRPGDPALRHADPRRGAPASRTWRPSTSACRSPRTGSRSSVPRRGARAQGRRSSTRARCGPRSRACACAATGFFGLLSRGAGRPPRPGLDDERAWPRSRSACCSGSRACAPRSSPCPTGPSRSPASPARALALAGELRLPDAAPRPTTTSTSSRRAAAASTCGRCRSTSRRGCKELLFDAGAGGRAHLGHPGGGRRLRLREGPPRHRAEPTSCCSPRPSTTRSRRCSTCRGTCRSPQSPAFVERAAEEVVRLLELSRGRAFVLFTSYANMNAVAERIAGRVDYPLLIQGEAPKAQLLDTFRAHAARGAPRDRLLLAGRRRGGRAALLRDHRQAALRLARATPWWRRASSGCAAAARTPSASTRCRWRCSC